jgi:hypothetical protein
MYCTGLGFEVLGRFEDHQGFDGVMLGKAGMQYHFEFTFSRALGISPTPTDEDLAVFYVPDSIEWREMCTRMLAAGFDQVSSSNPYWDVCGRTFEDPDRYRIVLYNAEWNESE